MLDVLIAIKGHVSSSGRLISMSGVVEFKDHEPLAVGSSEIQSLGLLELTNGGIKPCSDRNLWLLVLIIQGRMRLVATWNSAGSACLQSAERHTAGRARRSSCDEKPSKGVVGDYF